jgi:hypothetical protein
MSGHGAGGNSDNIEQLHARIRELEDALGQHNKSLAVTFKLSKGLGNLLGVLMAQHSVTAQTIHQQLEIATDAKVAIHRLRHQMKPYGIEINARRGIGYWLDEATKARVREMIDTPSQATPPPIAAVA